MKKFPARSYIMALILAGPGLSGTDALANWGRSVRTPKQVNLSLKSGDKALSMELSCRRSESGSLVFTIALDGPRGADISEVNYLKIDSDPVKVRIAGVDGGWMISDLIQNNEHQISSQLYKRLREAKLLQLSYRVKRKMKSGVFETDNSLNMFRYLDAECAKVER